MEKPSKICWYDKLSCPDLREWEDGLIKWGEKHDLKACMVFNPELLSKVKEELEKTSGKRIKTEEYVPHTVNVYKMTTDRLVIEYFEITVRKALLARISIRDPETFKEKLIYTVPDEWINSIWYAF